MPDFYQSDPQGLTDEELGRLIEELEGAVDEDADCAPEGSWERQAADRLETLWDEEQRRWDLGHPEEVEKRERMRALLAPLDAITHRAVEEMVGKIFESSPLIERLRRAK